MHLFSLSICIMRHPFDTFRALQASREKFSYVPSAILLMIILAVRIFSMYIIHYPLSATAAEDINVAMEIMKFVIPLVTWAFSLFAVTSIMDGETKINEAITSTLFCMMPYILMMIPLSLLSLLLSRLDSSIYNGISTGISLWCGFLFFLSVKVMNNYTVKKTVLVVLLILFGMALIWAVGLLIFALSSQFGLFAEGILKEARFAIFGY